MRRYPGNHTDSELLTVPRFLKTRPQAPTTHLAYITDDEAELLKEYKPGTPHEGAEGIPNYDTWGIDSSGNVTGGSTAGGGGGWSGDTGGSQREPERDRSSGGGHHQDWNQIQQDIKAEQKRKAEQKARSIEAQKRVDAARKLRPPEKTHAQKIALSKQSSDLALALNKAGINSNQLQRYIKAGIIPENVARAAGWVTEGEHWDPTAKFGDFTTEERFKGLGDFQTAREEGVYGGVSGNEAVVNQTKNAVLDAQNRLDSAINEMEWNKAKEDLRIAKGDLESVMGGPGIVNQMFDANTGKFKEGFGPDQFTGTFADMSFRDIEETAGRYTGRDEEGHLLRSGWEPNMDPETNIYQKYLNIGKNPWDDPRSGILNPRGRGVGGGGGGGGWGGWGGYGGGGGGGGGYGYGGEQQPPPRGYQRAGVGPGTLQEQVNQVFLGMSGMNQAPGIQKKRGGIVSLLELRS